MISRIHLKYLLVLFITLALIILVLLVSDRIKDKNINEPETTIETIKIDKDLLVEAYRNDIWDGLFIYDEEHCASIVDGVLWIDCQSTDIIPDAKEDYYGSVICYNSEGTWISNDNFVSVWSKGYQKNNFKVGNSQYSTIYMIDDFIIAYGTNTLWVHDIHGKLVQTIEQVHDCYINNYNELLYSTFNHNNYVITGNKILELESSYVRFPRENFTISEYNSNMIKKILNMYYETNWDGSCKKIDKNFVAFNSSGEIIVNNTIISQTPIIRDVDNNGNIIDEFSYWLNGSKLIKFKTGEFRSIDIPYGMYSEILYTSKSGLVLQVYDKGFYTIVVVYPDNTTRIVSTKAVDSHVAYNTLYYMEKDVVYSLEWENPDAVTSMFFEGAYGVSPYSNEAEGAIVPSDQSNYMVYGSKYIFSPYGK